MKNKVKDLNRCLILKNDFVDIKSFKILFFRSNHILLGLIVLASLSFVYLTDQDFREYVSKTIHFEDSIKDSYLFYKDVLDKKGDTYQDFYERQAPKYIDEFLSLSFLLFILIFPWLLYLFWPQRCPIRVDKERNLIYTWSWGKLYASRFDNLNPKKKDTAHFLEIRGGWGPLILSLYPVGSKKAKRVSVGSYIPKFNYQNHQLLDFIRNYLNGFTTIPSDFKPERGFLEKTLVKDRSFPEKEKLNQAIDEWLAKEKTHH